MQGFILNFTSNENVSGCRADVVYPGGRLEGKREVDERVCEKVPERLVVW